MSEESEGTEAVAEQRAQSSEALPTPAHERCDIFISYRIDPDQGLAVALKRLLETTILPRPGVFVSGAGGVRPHSIGLRPQLQKAVQEARAFVGLLTPESKDREWVIFEAGAAWGRGQIYAPVLVTLEPGDLGTTIGDYVATRAANRDEMAILLGSIAAAVGGRVRSRFAARYSAFQRQLEQRTTLGLATKDMAADGPVTQAIRLWFSGKRDDARGLLTRVEVEAPEPEQRAKARIHLLSLEHDENRLEFAEALHSLGDEYRATAQWQMWAGILAGTPHESIQRYDALLGRDDLDAELTDSVARFRAADMLRVGRTREGTEAILSALQVRERRLRGPFVEVLLDGNRDLTPLAKLVLIACSARADQDPLHKALADTAIEQSWAGLGLWAATRCQVANDTGPAFNNLGRACHAAGFYSLAHNAYRKAADAGTSVAKVNMAANLARVVVPAAGLAILHAHSGEFDAASPEFAHETRARLEKLVSEEEKKAKAVRRNGAVVFAMLAELADEMLGAPPGAQRDQETAESSAGVVHLARISPLPNAWEARHDGTFIGIFVQTSRAEFRGLCCDFSSGESEPTWTILRQSHGAV